MDHATIIDIFTECGAAVEALEQEHAAADTLLEALNAAMHSGAEKETRMRIFDQAVSFLQAHFANEETLLRCYGNPDIDDHAAAHVGLTERMVAIRRAINDDGPEATLDAADLFNALHTHVDQWDRPAFERLLAADPNLTVFQENQLEHLHRQNLAANSVRA
jgi:hemerythrin-like metal-binding protein